MAVRTATVNFLVSFRKQDTLQEKLDGSEFWFKLVTSLPDIDTHFLHLELQFIFITCHTRQVFYFPYLSDTIDCMIMNYIKTIFVVGIVVLIFPMLGFPNWFENLLLVILGIVLLVASLALRRHFPHSKKIDESSTSFEESDVETKKGRKKRDTGHRRRHDD